MRIIFINHIRYTSPESRLAQAHWAPINLSQVFFNLLQNIPPN
ncbi:MAG: hypothetical protein JWP58_1793 [Hymenobacter sp.]|nr:hypothetical protein [Hymenobacter sp.]